MATLGTTAFPVRIQPLNNIQPFTYRDGMTHLALLEKLRVYINDTLRVEFNDEMERIISEFNAALQNSEDTVTEALATWQASFDAFMANVEAEIALINEDIIKTIAVARDKQVVDVRDHGAIGDGVTNDAAAIQTAADLAADLGIDLLITGGVFRVNSAINLKPGVGNTRRGVIIDGQLVAGANTPALVATGSWGLSKAIAADIAPNGRTLTVDSNAWFVPGETLFITSNDVVPNAPDKLGCLRKVISNTGTTTVNVDTPFYRTMLVASSLRAFKTVLHPGVDIHGSGNIRSINNDNNTHLIEITLCVDPVVNMDIGPSGGPGVLLAHCEGFRGEGYIHDLVDMDTPDGNGLVHFGYGWNVAGASRNGYIGGRAYKCRHAFTTNTATTADGFGGEPENILTDIVTSRCSNKAIDTHRAGFNITHIVNDSGSYGALQVRADAVHAVVYCNGTYDAAVSTGSLITIPPTFERVEVHGSGGTLGLGLLLLSTSIVGDVVTRNCRTAISIEAPSCRISSVDANGLGAGTGSGISIKSNNNTIGDLILENVGTGIFEDVGFTGNILYGVRRFTNVGTTISLQAYNHMMPLRVGEYQVNAAAPTTIKGRYPVYDNAGNQYGVIPVYTT